MLYKT